MTARHPVYVVDDDASVRDSLRFLLSNAGHLVTCYANGDAFLAAVPKLERGCVLLDIRMDGLDGLAVQRQLRERGLAFAVIILTGHGDVPMAVTAMKQGAIDFLAKPFARDDLLEVIDRAMAQLDDAAAAQLQASEAAMRLKVLTPREREVMSGLARGMPNKTIAYDLGISPRTVEIHRANVMHKLAVRSFPEALRIAFAAGLPEDWPARSE